LVIFEKQFVNNFLDINQNGLYPSNSLPQKRVVFSSSNFLEDEVCLIFQKTLWQLKPDGLSTTKQFFNS